MIDLHSHILPGIDDGSRSIDMSLAMAEIAVADGIKKMACTPHITPGLYDNNKDDILKRIVELQRYIDDRGIPLKLYSGADVHLDAQLEKRLTFTVPTLNGSRYFLLEPPHRVLPPNMPMHMGNLIKHGFIPIITHPERLAWAHSHYGVIEDINDAGCLIQLTAASLTGRFGESAKKLSFQLIEDGRVDILASDTHDPDDRPPALSQARDIVADMIGEPAAQAMVNERPAMILANKTLVAAGKSPLNSRKRSNEKTAFSIPRWLHKLRK